MSKAFVKETDDEGDRPDEPPAIPSGIKNYMTPEGHRHMQNELRQLLRMERPKVVETVAWAAGNGDRSENGDYIYGRKRLREIDRELNFLSRRMKAARGKDSRVKRAALERSLASQAAKLGIAAARQPTVRKTKRVAKGGKTAKR